MTKIVVVGLDGADPNLIELWREHLPNLGRIMKNGVYGNLESTIPAATVPAWYCFSSGKNPGKIGVYWFVNLTANGTTRIADSTLCDSPKFWDVLSRFGKCVGLLNIPGTYPPTEVNGFIVSGMLSPLSSKNYTYPLKLRKELNELVNGYEIDPFQTDPKRMGGGEEEFLDELERIHSKRLEATKYLMKRYDWDFFMVVFRSIDLVQHHFWHHMDEKHPKYDLIRSHRYRNTIRNWYVKIDEAIGQIAETIDREVYLFIMSDHGCGPSNSCFYINEWLQKQGFLKLRSEISNYRDNLGDLKNLLCKHLSPSLIRRLLHIIPPSFILKGTRAGSSKRSLDKLFLEVDWSNTKAFALGGPSSNIYVNLKGRTTWGTVEPGRHYEETRDQIIEKLRQTRFTATGERVSTNIYKKEELYWGKHSDIAPDLAVEFFSNGSRCTVYTSIGDGRLWGESPTSGAHLRDGVWMVIGPKVIRQKMHAKITDLAPTILYLLRVPVPKDMDGKVLRQAFSLTQHIKYFEISPDTTKTEKYSATAREELEERLRGLGYL